MREDFYQLSMIFLLVVVAGLFGMFVYKELFPEYKLYQNRYVELEQLRAEVTGGQVPPFRSGVKQIVMLDPDNGPEKIDRCTSCHVALDLEHFSPTVPARDVNGNLVLDAQGHPVLVENKDYVWGMVDQQIAALTDPERQQSLKENGQEALARQERQKAKELEELKHVEVGHHHYDMTKVLAMHPLLGKETRPFQMHPIEEMGCTSCHNGNGRGLVTDKAHGPVFDGQYHAESHGPTPQFVETDEKNDPTFSKAFNHKPGHELLFQTEPLFIGTLMEAKCAQCHASAEQSLKESTQQFARVTGSKVRELQSVREGLERDMDAVLTLIDLESQVQQQGIDATVAKLRRDLADPSKTDREQNQLEGQLSYIEQHQGVGRFQQQVSADLEGLIGSESLINAAKKLRSREALAQFLEEQAAKPGADGSLFRKQRTLADFEEVRVQLENVQERVDAAVNEPRIATAVSTDVDRLTGGYQKGQRLFMSQACYACHRIAGLSRGGVGPELSEIGLYYPWYIKESMVWPQANLKSSTMPNFRLDHEEIEALMTFLMAQTGQKTRLSEVDYRIDLSEWEAGRKQPFEQELNPSKVNDVRSSMHIFATEGCASCHMLKGFDSEIGYAAESGGGDWDSLYQESQWFRSLFPDFSTGSQIVATIEQHEEELEKRIVHGVHKDAVLDEIEERSPGTIDSFYTNFKFAMRSKNHLALTDDPAKKQEVQRWKDLVRRVQAMYIQEYGLGRWIGPPLHWSGVYREDWWLMEHFRNPAAHAAKSIMPVLPFDDTKFYALTHLLNVMGERNRNEVREIWSRKGFNPEMAFGLHCANCHGEYAQGNGPTAEWIYPIPKNLHNATFLRNLTKERAVESIMYGVLGGPMPPWGVAPQKPDIKTQHPVLTEAEARELVDWLYLALPGANVLGEKKDVLKWQYEPEDVIKEMQQEGDSIDVDDSLSAADLASLFPEIPEVFVSTEPKVYVGSVDELFDVVDDATGKDSPRYYIKRKYYTEENLKAGEELFSFHCSVCHGSEGAGNGTRAETMEGAKPRMLSNPNWIETRDDLRLLRSLKYGVPGTSMTPWGDVTSSLQRCQLVMFIRSLTEQRRAQDAIVKELALAFEKSVGAVTEVRAVINQRLLETQQQYAAAQNTRISAQASGSDQAVEAYRTELRLGERKSDYRALDAILAELKTSFDVERQLLEGIGRSLIEQQNDRELADWQKQLVKSQAQRISVDGVAMRWQLSDQSNQQARQLSDRIVGAIRRQLDDLSTQQKVAQGKMPSPQRLELLESLQEKRLGLEGLLHKVASGFEEMYRLHEKQRELVQRYSQQAQRVG